MEEHRIKVLFNSPNPKLHGGPPTHLPLLEEELRQRTVLEIFQYGRRTDSESIINKFVVRSNDLITLRSQIYSFKPDIIHHNTAFDARAVIRDAALVWLAKQHRVPLLLKMHGSCGEMFDEIKPPLRQLRNAILKNASCIGVLSEAERNDYLRTWPFLGDRVKVVKNIVKAVFHTVIRRESEYPSVLFVSRFMREKGMFDLLEAVPRVLERFPAAEFIFLGSGADAGDFDREVKEKDLSRSVKRIEHMDNVETARFYATAWVLVFPTRLQEGMPMVVAEAMAAGVPVITTRTKFSQSYMTAGKHCLFIEDKSPESIEHSITYLLEQSVLRQDMSRSNRELARSFQREIVTTEFINIYKQLLDRYSKGEIQN